MNPSSRSFCPGEALVVLRTDRPTSPPPPESKYRPDIDGLRAVAVLLVVYHAFPSLLPGGFIGVDIFFVISGFLITTIILQSLAAGDFSFKDFYVRRVRRIFPALVLVLLVDAVRRLVPAAVGRVLPNSASRPWAAPRSLPTWCFWGESGYFDTAARPSRCCICGRWASRSSSTFSGRCCWAAPGTGSGRSCRLVLAIAAVVSAGQRGAIGPSRRDAFYLAASRAWELMVGGSSLACGWHADSQPVAQPPAVRARHRR